jgi:hypothetical protein
MGRRLRMGGWVKGTGRGQRVRSVGRGLAAKHPYLESNGK